MKNKIIWYTNWPPENTLVYVSGEFIRGIYAMVNNMWYTQEEFVEHEYEDIDGYDADSVNKWTWLPDDEAHSESEVHGENA